MLPNMFGDLDRYTGICAFELRLPVGKIQRLRSRLQVLYGVYKERTSVVVGAPVRLMQHQSSDWAALSFGSSSAFSVGSKSPAILSVSM